MSNSRSSPDLRVYEFGKQLLEKNDLDPVYVLLWEAQLSPKQLQKWLLAYWCFYHIGTASWIVDQPSYWEAFKQAAGSKEWPRCSERRHFRGENARKSVEYLCSRGVSDLFDPLLQEQLTVGQIMRYVQTWVGFGPWISFKVADMLERLDIAPVRFDAGTMFLFDSPREGAELLYRTEGGTGGDPNSWAVDRILKQLGHHRAPPRNERTLNVQEAETCLCKWKSYKGGHYRPGEDVESCQNGLRRFPQSLTSQKLYQAGERSGLW